MKFEKLLPPHRFRMYRLIEKKIKEMGLNDSLLDVGCGNCSFMKRFFWFKKVLGVDIGTVADNVITKDYLKVKLKRKFEVITCLITLEHVLKDYDFIKKFNHDLKKRGYLFLAVPSKNHFHHINKYSLHFRTYEKNQLISLLKNYFEIISVEHLGFPTYNIICYFYNIYLKMFGMKKKPDFSKKGIVTSNFIRLLFPLFYPFMYLDYFFKNTSFGTHYLIKAKVIK